MVRYGTGIANVYNSLMKLVTCRYRNQVCMGVMTGNGVALPMLSQDWDSRLSDVQSLIEAGDGGMQALRAFSAASGDEITVAMDDVRLMAPILRPRKNIICMGWNYSDHLRETKTAGDHPDLPQYPIMFTKAASCVTGPFDDIPHDPGISDKLDWEVELGVVIGRAGHKVPPEKALEYVFGYVVINDITARELQKRHKQFYLSKSLPASCPIGPAITTADEIPNPQVLRLQCRVNGELKQDASTAFQIFDVATVISYISKCPGLEAGDIIATGTPAGVGYARKPPEYLRPGDTVECEVETVGRIANTVVPASG